MQGFSGDFREALTSKMRCLGTSSLVLAKYMAIVLIPLYIIYLIIT
ncbi:hypothetical protein [Planococcus sp. ISL-109]|nr:hypothetical protein [Planococcus sp. ISL-109]MBT2583437.1 hypothetical protein [Planococcus sp. ISL-109]